MHRKLYIYLCVYVCVYRQMSVSKMFASSLRRSHFQYNIFQVGININIKLYTHNWYIRVVSKYMSYFIYTLF